jgi:hypothetical protein
MLCLHDAEKCERLETAMTYFKLLPWNIYGQAEKN